MAEASGTLDAGSEGAVRALAQKTSGYTFS
jgi:hypothetical protein